MPQRIEPLFYLFGHSLLLSLLLPVFRQLISVLLRRLHIARGFLKALLNFGCLVDLLLPILLELSFIKLDGLLVADAPRVGRNVGRCISGDTSL